MSTGVKIVVGAIIVAEKVVAPIEKKTEIEVIVEIIAVQTAAR